MEVAFWMCKLTTWIRIGEVTKFLGDNTEPVLMMTTLIANQRGSHDVSRPRLSTCVGEGLTVTYWSSSESAFLHGI